MEFDQCIWFACSRHSLHFCQTWHICHQCVIQQGKRSLRWLILPTFGIPSLGYPVPPFGPSFPPPTSGLLLSLSFTLLSWQVPQVEQFLWKLPVLSPHHLEHSVAVSRQCHLLTTCADLTTLNSPYHPLSPALLPPSPSSTHPSLHLAFA